MKYAERRTRRRMRPLSVRERKLIKQIPDIIAGKPMSAALQDAGFSETTAKKQQKRIIGNSRFQAAIQKAFEKAGISDNKLIQVMKEGLQATKVISTMTKDFIKVPDHATRHKYLDTAYKLRGDYPAEKRHVDSNIATSVAFEVVNDG